MAVFVLDMSTRNQNNYLIKNAIWSTLGLKYIHLEVSQRRRKVWQSGGGASRIWRFCFYVFRNLWGQLPPALGPLNPPAMPKIIILYSKACFFQNVPMHSDYERFSLFLFISFQSAVVQLICYWTLQTGDIILLFSRNCKFSWKCNCLLQAFLNASKVTIKSKL